MTDVNTIKSSVMDEASCTASSHDERRRVITTPPVPVNTTLSGLTINKIVETGKKCNESRDSFPAAGIISTLPLGKGWLRVGLGLRWALP